MNKIYGYIRVSTLSQYDDRQWLAMDTFGVMRNCVFATNKAEKILKDLSIKNCSVKF